MTLNADTTLWTLTHHAAPNNGSVQKKKKKLLREVWCLHPGSHNIFFQYRWYCNSTTCWAWKFYIVDFVFQSKIAAPRDIVPHNSTSTMTTRGSLMGVKARYASILPLHSHWNLALLTRNKISDLMLGSRRLCPFKHHGVHQQSLLLLAMILHNYVCLMEAILGEENFHIEYKYL